MGLIRIDIEMLKNNEKTMEGKIQELMQLNSSLQTLILQIGDSWEGDASAAYIQLMQRYREQAGRMESVLDEFKKYIHVAIEKTETVDRECAARLHGSF